MVFEDKRLIIVINVGLLIIIGITHYFLSSELATFLFYIIPIGLLSYQNNISKSEAIIFAIIAGIQWFTIDSRIHSYTNELYMYWNSIIRLLLFLLTAITLKTFYNERQQRFTIKHQHEEIKVANEKLLKTNNELNIYIGMAAHDIRNSVGTILGFSELLLEDDQLTSSSKKLVTFINKSAFNSLEILNTTLTMSQLRSGVLVLNKTHEDYIEYVKEKFLLLSQMASLRNQRLEFRSVIDFITLEFDKIRIEQVLNNLVSNALKYSAPNGTIIIDISYDNSYFKGLKTSVIDQGFGIDTGYKTKIFEPFVTTSNTPTGNESKSGLGLAISKKMIELHGGHIGFTSEKGVGSTFYFILPITSIAT